VAPSTPTAAAPAPAAPPAPAPTVPAQAAAPAAAAPVPTPAPAAAPTLAPGLKRPPARRPDLLPRAADPIFPGSRTRAQREAKAGVQDMSMTHRALHPLVPLRQFVTLCLRMITVIASDRGYSIFLLGLPLALAVLSRAVPGDKGLTPDVEHFSLQ